MNLYTSVESNYEFIFHRYVDSAGKQHFDKISDYPLEIFTEYPLGKDVSLMGDKLQLQRFESVKKFSEYCRKTNHLYGQTSAALQFISNEYTNKIVPDVSRYSIFCFDIEVHHSDGFPNAQVADQEILSITIKRFGREMVTLGTKPLDRENYIECADEHELLMNFLENWKSDYPNIVTGFYINGFDIPYLVNRMNRVLGSKYSNQLSPFYKDVKTPLKKRVINKADEEYTYNIFCVETLDYIDIYKKFTPNRLESYTLDYISEFELGEKKVDYSDYNNDLMELYRRNFNKFIRYNEQDVLLIESLDDKLQYIKLAMMITYFTQSKVSDALGTTGIWDSMVYNHLKKKGIQIPPKKDHKMDDQLVGGFVYPTIPGKYSWIATMDLTSLYPSIIRMLNLSPETLISNASPNKKKVWQSLYDGEMPEFNNDVIMAANGSRYRKDIIGVLPELMGHLMSERVVYKNEMKSLKKDREKKPSPELDEQIDNTDTIQTAIKRLANSGYGACAEPHFRYFNFNIAEAITMTGQLVTRSVITEVDRFLNERLKTKDVPYVIAGDTDSIMINLGGFIEKLGVKDTRNLSITQKHKVIDVLDNFISKELNNKIDALYNKIKTQLNAEHNFLTMKREALADSALFRAKKNYILQVYDMEGVRFQKPIIKAVGIEAVKSSTPKLVKDMLNECYLIMLNGYEDELIEHVKKYRREFNKVPIKQIAAPIGVSNISKFISSSGVPIKGTPINSRAAITYNDYIEKMNLANVYQKIKEGNKIRYFYLKTPNPTGSYVIGFIDEIPPEFNLDSYVDIDNQWNKLFAKPLLSFANLLSWKIEKQKDSIEDLFS